VARKFSSAGEGCVGTSGAAGPGAAAPPGAAMAGNLNKMLSPRENQVFRLGHALVTIAAAMRSSNLAAVLCCVYSFQGSQILVKKKK
jgi:hypothetical protein